MFFSGFSGFSFFQNAQPTIEIIRHCSSSKSSRAVKFSYQRPGASSSQDSEKRFRKYYGKRVARLTSSDVSNTKCPSNRLKAIRSFSATGVAVERCPSRAIRKLDFHYVGALFRDKRAMSLLHSVSQFKYLTDLSLWMTIVDDPLHEAALFKRIRKLGHLQSLEITLSKVQLVRVAKYLLSLNIPKTLKIQVLETSPLERNIVHPESLEFYLKLLKSKTLQFLELDLTSVNQEAFTNSLIKAINETNLPSFHLLLKVTDTDSLNPEELNEALQNLDFFTLRSMGPVAEYSCNTTKGTDMSLNQAKKRLTLEQKSGQNLPKSSIPFEKQDTHPLKDVNKLLLTCLNLCEQVIPEVSNFRSLKSLHLLINNIPLLPTAVESLMNIIKQAVNLEDLKLIKVPSFGPSEFDFTKLKPFLTEISKLTKLKSLELKDFTIAQDLISTITYPLPFLKDLRELQLDISLNDGSIGMLPLTLEFPEPCNLTELTITVPDIDPESRINLLQNVSKLGNLKRLIISNGLQFFDDIKFRKILGETLGSLPLLREITARDTSRKGAQSSENENKEVAAEMNQFALTLMSKNINLEKVSFDKHNAYEISHERYENI